MSDQAGQHDAGGETYDSGTSPDRFWCNVCNRGFPTKEALDHHVCHPAEDEKVKPFRVGVSTVPIDLGAYANETDWNLK